MTRLQEKANDLLKAINEYCTTCTESHVCRDSDCEFCALTAAYEIAEADSNQEDEE